MQEVEIKIKILPAQLSTLRSWLIDKALFVGSEDHEEYYLNNPQISFYTTKDELKDSDTYLRIRSSNKGASICLKKWHPDTSRPGQYTHCDEYETNIEDSKVLLALFKEIGFIEIDPIKKHREKYRSGKFEIVIDEVEELGVFVEIEYKDETNDVKKARQDIMNFIKQVGIYKFQIQNRGYVSMRWNPGFDFGEEINFTPETNEEDKS